MEFVLIPAVAAAASLLTFFSGFGLGTLLLPAFAVFYPPEMAIALTAVVHLLNNLFKGGLVGVHANWKVVFVFGLPAIGGAFLGAWLLDQVGHQTVVYSYFMGSSLHVITWTKLIVAMLMIFFALFEILPKLRNLEFNPQWLPAGGVISGFFGGLSGHQGALRSAFLVRLKMEKATFIATGTLIAILIDVTRLSFYGSSFSLDFIREHAAILSVSVAAAFLGAFAGNKLLKKVTLGFVQMVVAFLLIALAVLLGSGII